MDSGHHASTGHGTRPKFTRRRSDNKRVAVARAAKIGKFEQLFGSERSGAETPTNITGQSEPVIRLHLRFATTVRGLSETPPKN